MNYALINQKGGVSKTTSAVNLSGVLAEMGFRVLLIDADPQGNASTAIGFNKMIDDTIYNALIDEWALEDVIYDTKIDNLHIVPSNIKLARAELELSSAIKREYRLKESMDKSDLFMYDFVIIDTPPSLGLLTLNVIAATSKILIPINADDFAIEGLLNLSNTIHSIGRKLNNNVEISGIFFANIDSRLNIDDYIETVGENTGKLLKTIVHKYRVVENSHSYGEPINLFAPESKSAEEYRQLAKEVLENAPKRA